MSDVLTRARWCLLVTAAALVVGCGGGDDDATTAAATQAAATTTATPTTTTTATETATTAEPATGGSDAAIATSAVLLPADLPADWTAGDTPPDASPSPCATVKRARATTVARARSRDFTHGELAQAGHIVYLYRDAAAARKAYRELGGLETRRCLAEGVGKAVTTSSGSQDLEVGEATERTLAISAIGDDSTAARVTLPLRTRGLNVPLNVDLVLVRQGRGLSLLTLLQVADTFDAALRSHLTTTAATRLQEALDQA